MNDLYKKIEKAKRKKEMFEAILELLLYKKSNINIQRSKNKNDWKYDANTNTIYYSDTCPKSPVLDQLHKKI